MEKSVLKTKPGVAAALELLPEVKETQFRRYQEHDDWLHELRSRAYRDYIEDIILRRD
jgi:hypothetical protein